jgi:oxalate decarboxylase/phosphoglucose isomerase-like protein (cupin superfamily)
MTSWKDIKIDDQSLWPTRQIVDLDPAHVDDRGSIQSIVNLPMKNASIITSVKGAVRSNHYHRTDWHFMYTLSGSYDYYYRPTGSNEPLKVIHVGPGQLIFTPPMEDHATVFSEDTTLLVVSRNARDQTAYESDVVRVTLVSPAGVPVA